MKKTSMHTTLKLAAALLLAIPTLASATILATNGFDDNTVGPLNGKGGGTGWNGNWTAPGNVTRADVVDTTSNPMSFVPTNGIPIDGGTRALEVALTGAAASQLCGVRTLATPIAQTFYAAYLVRYQGTGIWAGGNNTFTLHLSTNNSSTTTLNFGIRGDGAAGANEFIVRFGTGGPVAGASTGGQLVNSNDYYLVLRVNYNGTAFDSANLWLNPAADAESTTPSGNASLTGLSFGPVTHIFFRQAVLDADDILRADQIVLGNAWTNVVAPMPPIPMVRVETKADGTGVVVPTQDLVAGNSITGYAIARDAGGAFLYNTTAGWSVENVTGGVVSGDLVPASNRKSATFTGHIGGSCTLRASANATNTVDSGTITVLAGTATQVRVETDPTGTGTVVPAQSLAPGFVVQGYAISRDNYGNFLGNIAATWSLTNKTSAVVDGDLVAAPDNKSATFTAKLSGTANIRAASGTLASVDSGLLTVSRALTWVGGGANPWDFVTSNWTTDFGATSTKFLDSDDVTFDFGGSMTPAVNLLATVKPHSVTVIGGPYTMGGAFGISGVATLTNSSGTLLTLLNTNDYSGLTSVSLSSTLQLGNGVKNGSFGTGPVRIDTGGTSPIFNRTDAASAPYVVSNTISGVADFLMEFKTGAVKFAGTGDNTHARAVVRNGATLLLAKTTGKDLGNLVSVFSGPVLDIEVGGMVICGGPGTSADHIDSGGNTAQGLRYVTINGTFDLNSNETLGGITDGSSGTINNSSTNAAVLTVGNGINDSSTATFAGTIQNTGSGNLGVTKDATNTWILNAANTYRGDTRITGGGILQMGNVNALQGSTLDRQTADTGELSFGTLASANLGGLKGARGFALDNTTPAAVALSIGANGQNNTYSGALGGSGSLNKTGAGTQSMSGTNTYSGNTTVSVGTLLVNGALANGNVTVASTATLGGTGVIGGVTTVQIGGKMAPGNNAIGKLTVNNTATLQGSAIMEINRSLNAPTNCDVLAATTLNLGGSLTVTNVGPALKTGDTFTLFSGGLGGSITPATLPALWPGLTWDTSLLNSAGKITVTGTAIPPVIGSVGKVGDNLVLSGTGGLAGSTYYLVNSTNVTAALATWTRIATNVFALNGGFTNVVPINPAVPGSFYSMQVP